MESRNRTQQPAHKVFKEGYFGQVGCSIKELLLRLSGPEEHLIQVLGTTRIERWSVVFTNWRKFLKVARVYSLEITKLIIN